MVIMKLDLMVHKIVCTLLKMEMNLYIKKDGTTLTLLTESLTFMAQIPGFTYSGMSPKFNSLGGVATTNTDFRLDVTSAPAVAVTQHESLPTPFGYHRITFIGGEGISHFTIEGLNHQKRIVYFVVNSGTLGNLFPNVMPEVGYAHVYPEIDSTSEITESRIFDLVAQKQTIPD